MTEVNFYRYSRTMERAIANWLRSVTSLTIIAERQKEKAPRPYDTDEGFASYLIGPPQKLGRDDLTLKAGDVFTWRGTRVFHLTVTVYGNSPFEIAGDLHNSLEQETYLLPLKAAGIYVQKAFDIEDTSALLETGYETRATLDLTFATRVSYDETTYYIGECTGIEGTVTAPSGEDYGETFTV